MEENKKRGNVLTIILVVLLLIAVGIICYLLGSNNANNDNRNNSEIKEENNKNNNDVNSETNEEESIITPTSYSPKCSNNRIKQQNLSVDIDDTKYNNIIEYIEEQQNVEVIIEYCYQISNTEDFDGGRYKLTENEKNSVFNEMKKSTYNIVLSELGGMCVDDLKITYERKNKQYEVSYYSFFAMDSNDGNIYKILDKSVNNTLSQEEKEYCGYHFSNLSSTANSILNRLESN